MNRLLKNRIPRLLVASFVCLLLLVILNPAKASAAYEAGRLIDDAVLLDARSMDIGQIQAFLNGRGGQIASKSFRLDCDAAGQQSKQLYLSVGAPCGQTIPAANIIYYSAQVYGINPKVIMATMQKEQSLITATNPTDRQYAQAMGYACPTSGSCNDSSNFFWQIDNGTWVLRYHFERARGNMTWWRHSTSWTCGEEKNLYKPNLYPNQNVRFYDTNGTHYATVYIQNPATSSFYCYTPHAYNNPQGLYGRAPYGTTGLYYSGSYNFVLFFEQWFGSTRADPGYSAVVNKYNNLGGVNSWLGASITGINAAGKNGLYQIFEGGTIYWHKDTGAWTVRKGAVNNRYATIGYEYGYLGFPKSDEISIPGKGVYQQFEGGSMYWTSSAGAWDVRYGAMFNRFSKLGYESSYLGFPISGEVKAGVGAYQNFQGGRLYWRPLLEAMDMPTNLVSTYVAAGAQNSYLGLPNTSTACNLKDNGCWVRFDGGKIYWSASSGAFDVHAGAVDEKYAELGYEGGVLGYPTSREIPTGQTCAGFKDVKQEFQNGTIYWSKCSAPMTSVEY